MKVLLNFTILISFLLLYSNANCITFQYHFFDKIDDAIEYNDKMIQIQAKVDDCLVILLDAIDTHKKYYIKGAYKECKETIKKSKSEIKKVGKFKNDDQYQIELLKLLKMYEDILKNEIRKIIKFAIKPNELVESDYDTYYDLYDSALSKYDKAFNVFQTFQQDFAKKWNFTIEN